MVTRRYENHNPTQDGAVVESTVNRTMTYQNHNVSESIVPNTNIHVYRLNLWMPKHSAIQTGIFRANINAVSQTTFPQSMTFDLNMEMDAPPFPETTNTVVAAAGNWPPAGRAVVANGLTGLTYNYTANTDAQHILSVNIQGMLNDAVNRDDYYPGIPVAIYLKPTAETGDLYINHLEQTSAIHFPRIEVTYDAPPHLYTNLSNESYPYWAYGDKRHDVNLWWNQSAEKDSAGFHNNTISGYLADNIAIARSTEQKHSGTASVKVAGTATSTNPIGVTANWKGNRGVSYVFSGWVYIPSGQANVFPTIHYHGGYEGIDITERDKWVPFSTKPFMPAEDNPTIWAGLVQRGASGTGSVFYVDDVCFTESRFQNMPFTGYSPNTFDRTHKFVDDKWNSDKKGPSIRTTRATTSTTPTPYNVLDGMSNTSGWSNITYTHTITSDGDSVSVASPYGNSQQGKVRFTKTMPRTKKFLALRQSGSGSLAAVGMSDGTVKTYPKDWAAYAFEEIVGNTPPQYWYFFNLGDPSLSITYLEWDMPNYSGTQTQPVMRLWDIAEFDYPTAKTTPRPFRRYIKNQYGLWSPAESQRQSITAADFDGNGYTIDELESTGYTWDKLEGVDQL